MNWKIKKLGIAVLCLVFHLTLFGQKNWVATSGGPLESVDLIELELEESQLLANSRSVGTKEGAYHFAHEIKTNISIQEAGTWEHLDNGNVLWRQRIRSQGAYSLNLGFKEFRLPGSATMFLYDAEQSHIIGPITQEDNDTHGEWWSPIIPFEEVVVEIQVSPKESHLLKTIITDVNHDFYGFGALLSGSCNVDVVCGAEDGYAIIDQYRDIINSVGMYSINGRDICSGALINNVRNDCTPYLLTARHCEITESNAASIVVYWNYQQTTCRSPGSTASGQQGDGQRIFFNSGASLLSEYDNSDMALILLDDPVDPEVDAYFAGWDVTGNVLDSAICVHHPQTEEKRISLDYDPSTPFFNNQFYRILDWDEGTTESGSSGAPLFSTSKLIVGQLNGGAASCGNDEYDDFGMLAISWEGGGTPETSLKPWLDPDNTGVLTHGGRPCSDLILVSEPVLHFCTLQSRLAQTTLSIQSGYESGVSLSVNSISEGVSIMLSQQEVTTENPTVTLTLEIEEGFNQTIGEVVIAINSTNGEDLITIKLMVDAEVPTTPLLQFPEDETSNVSYDIDLSWETNASSSQIEIYEVRADGMQSLVLSETLTINTYPIKTLKNNSTYQWRVRGGNTCGFGEYSSFYSFSTGNVFCELMNDSDLPQIIGTELDTIQSVISVEEDGSVIDVNVINVRGKHTFVSDLIMELKSPSGTIVELLSYKCQDADDFLVSFDDDSNIINTPCPINSQEAQRPVGSLGVFIGESAQGDWTLTIYDDVREDGGSFDSWSLELCVVTGENIERTVSFSPSEIEICSKESVGNVIVEGTIVGGESTIAIEFLGPQLDNINISPNPITGSGTRSFVISIDDIGGYSGGDVLQFLFKDEMGMDTLSIPIREIEIPETPLLALPANNLIGVDLRPFFEWSNTPLTDGYQFRVAMEGDTAYILDTIISTPSLKLPNRLELDTDYEWHVTALGLCVDVTSEIFSFHTTIIDATIDVTLQDVKVFPNPFTSKLTLEIPPHLRGKELTYEIINPIGQSIRREKLTSFTTVDVSPLSSGLYYVKLESPQGLWTQAIVKL